MTMKAYDRHSSQAREEFFRTRGRKSEKRQSHKNERRQFQRDAKKNWEPAY